MFPKADFYQKQKKGILKDPMPFLKFHQELLQAFEAICWRVFFSIGYAWGWVSNSEPIDKSQAVTVILVR